MVVIGALFLLVGVSEFIVFEEEKVIMLSVLFAGMVLASIGLVSLFDSFSKQITFFFRSFIFVYSANLTFLKFYIYVMRLTSIIIYIPQFVVFIRDFNNSVKSNFNRFYTNVRLAKVTCCALLVKTSYSLVVFLSQFFILYDLLLNRTVKSLPNSRFSV